MKKNKYMKTQRKHLSVEQLVYTTRHLKINFGTILNYTLYICMHEYTVTNISHVDYDDNDDQHNCYIFYK